MVFLKERTIPLWKWPEACCRPKIFQICFWGEAVPNIIYIINHTPTKAVQKLTPQEAWSAHKNFVAHLQK